MHCLSMYTDSVCYNKLMEHHGSCQCCLKCLYWSAHTLLFYIISLLFQLFFLLYPLFRNKKITFWFGIHCRLQANRIIQHGGSLLVASRSGVDSILDHEGAFSHNKAGIGLTILWVHTTDVCKPSGTHCRTKLIAQFIN